MLVFDQLRKDDPQLRFLATAVFGGLLLLLAGLWWVQVVSSSYYKEKLETQSVRTVRIPAVRGKILDRDGHLLAENLPRFNVDLYLEELSKNYQVAYSNAIAQTRRSLNQQAAIKQKQLGRKLTTQEKRQFAVNGAIIAQLQKQTRYEVTSNIVADLSGRINQPIGISEKDFQTKYDKARALPLTVLGNLTPEEVARFEEQSVEVPGMDLGVQSIRHYPNGSAAAHLLGYLVRNNDSNEGELAEYNYRLDDYVGVSGIEKLFDKELRGTAGARSVLVNNLGYRQSETVWSPAEPGQNVYLTIDLDIQKAAESALDLRENLHGALVVMDTRNGDILAMASAPGYNPNHFVQHPEQAVWESEWERWNDKDLEVQMNHTMQGGYPPGSIFKIVVGLAALEQGVLNPNETFHSLGYYPMPGRAKPIGDTAGAGDFDFDKALALSSNPYFITQGLKPGVLPRMVALGERLHFGERTGIVPRQEDRGYFPTRKDITSSSWRDGNTANLSIGQEKIAVTPLQIAVMISAVANGGTVLYPRLVSKIVPYGLDEPSQVFPERRVRDYLGVSQRSLRIVHEAMEMDVNSPNGTGREAAVSGLRIAGKTGTAEVEKNLHIDKNSKITWFASFAPAENPRYAVVVMVVSGASGGKTCAPIAHKVYEALVNKEKKPAAKIGAVATLK